MNTQEKLIIGKTIKMPAMRRGLVKYPEETILVNQNALEKLAKTSYGIPVVIEHPGVKITPENFKDIPVHGRVADMTYDEKTDEWMINFVVDTQEAVDCLNSGWGVSTAWIGENYGPSGTYNAMPYDRELLEGKYEHLAIVKDPRYEMAKGPVFYNSKNSLQEKSKGSNIIDNSQKTGSKKMLFKLFRMIKEEIKTNENESYMLNIAGQDVPLANVLEEMKAMEEKKNAEDKDKEEEEKKALNGDDMVEYNGQKMTVNELVEKYNCMKKNSEGTKGLKKFAEEEEKEEAHKDEKEEEKENEETKEEKEKKENEDKEKDEDAKQNALKEKERFDALKETHDNAHSDLVNEEFVTLKQRREAGNERYGSKK